MRGGGILRQNRKIKTNKTLNGYNYVNEKFISNNLGQDEQLMFHKMVSIDYVQLQK